MRLLPVSIAVATLLASSAAMSAIVFDFESAATGNYGASGAFTSGGVTMTVTRLDGSAVEVRSLGGFPASWGRNALSPFLNIPGGAFLLTFSSAFSAISVDTGDIAPSDADVFSLTVGSDVDTDSQSGSQGFPFFTTLSLTSLNSTTAILSGGSTSFPQSVFWDNISIELANQVPVPATLALAGAGLLLLGWQRRRA